VRQTLQLRQPRPRSTGAAQAFCRAEPTVLPLGALTLHPHGLHRAGAKM